MAEDKLKGDQEFKNHTGMNSNTSPAKPTSGLVSQY